MNHQKVAREVSKAVGEGNIQAAAHCATRLRLVLKDPSKVDHAALDNNDDVKGTFEANGQFQIIIGPGDVNKVYAELVKLTNVKEASTEDLKAVAAEGKKVNPAMAFIKVLSDIFVPIVPALVAGGLLMAINNVLTSPNLFGPQSVVEMFPNIKDVASIINLLSSAPFAFLPILVGFSATKRFGGNGYLGAAMGMAMVMPDLINGYGVANAIAEGSMPYWNIFGLQVAQAGYQGSVLPVLAVSWILATLEKFFHKKISAAFDYTFTPMLAIIITGFLTFIFVGPVMRTVSDGLTDGLVWLYQTTGAVGLGIFGLFYSPIVITGLHQSFPAIETTLLADVARTGGSFIFPVASMANIAQGAAALAIFVLSKNEKQKSLASSASISALLGITEPAIFGINLKLKFPFVCAMIASGIASVSLGIFHVLSVAMGPASVIGFISIAPKSIPFFMIGVVISFILGFLLTFIYGKKKMEVPATAAADGQEAVMINENPDQSLAVQDDVLSAVVTGEVLPLKEVKDPVFSTEMMGKGVAIIPESDQLFAPADGVLTVMYDSKHAYGIQADSGAEILIHIGIDTVNLAGQFFSTNKKKGERVKKGELLGTFDREAIKKAGYDDTVMLLVTNSAAYGDVSTLDKPTVTQGEDILAVSKAYE
ncbi:sucrose-specific PTS transporter subunit IIBC [Enterococcus raffinosus]|uniref:PTS system sucrose-specific EIIBCA component n=1 Tax=Enterococcus raffinosus TaxID=71452 RepID=A0AAW8TAR2_9ENTE|nr:sucrose-specific PTS transporter subunit IIBC [Enterococcus raffinosus]MBS6430699.1 sucrose-specific PTS transporter subunit IIBC [Enterococcus raffinosus]MDK7990766.1 sucrose-specific PTS transporter subunit IIBC [Enterococcus raffinosus]MDT2522720.1 sucrose-specific PTS transporter subunit IIBC [Enterococcus raffinosus]MDT2529889.1 sucrose-specific PTS transporter subunit IIBC [Enterococcus raffinosus]MDT2532913.1 sucrose-specific PTS transporter subunit IIBC [Enterococcus raffinosus]